MIWLYRFLFFPALILAAPYYLRRMRKRGGYGPNFSHRFGRTPPLPPKRPGVRRIWLQAVSVGEMLAVGPLLRALKTDESVEVYLTTTTSTAITTQTRARILNRPPTHLFQQACDHDRTAFVGPLPMIVREPVPGRASVDCKSVSAKCVPAIDDG